MHWTKPNQNLKIYCPKYKHIGSLKRMENIYHVSIHKRKLLVFKAKEHYERQKRTFYVSKRARHKNSKLYAPFYIASKNVELKLAGLKEEVNIFTTRWEILTHLSINNRTSLQNIGKR